MTAKRWHGGELRWDHHSGEWTVLAPGRAGRPHGAVTCPFCPGPGEDTPPETWRLPDPGGGWRMRAVPNRYALSDHHEVVIESPDHGWDLAMATDAEATALLKAWQHRHLMTRAGTAQVLVFRNHGEAAGTSLSHPHSQVVGLPVLSAATQRELAVAREHYDATTRPLAVELLAGELAHGERIVLSHGQAVAFTPFAPAANFEVRVVPTRHHADFCAASPAELAAVAHVLRIVLAALRIGLVDPPYNLIVHSAPTGLEQVPYLSWWLRILPRLSVPAGLELATGVPVSTVTPEDAAERLRAWIAGLEPDVIPPPPP
ncbi:MULTISPECIES: galactose-1-phosphate uridylyltransferase [Amycolatopsis]|uniref:UDPglucose--hexose-1-phosphate uridylyltransferase n=2 Tax=Amycolatopsis TaxID=1813 RepID=A0A1I3L192_9PSEU|nr:DUF4931 domain-containing protein [Amycolatopsis sacchari]SFI78408.1 UDPglucose--hexose-1-phosphate uridylyltransferase [Amycolatopsis sacchari]